MESCNCDYLCPCIFTNPQAPATHDHCTALMIYRIDAGRYGTVGLGGLCFALVIRSGPVMADGGWVFACVIDAGADTAQRAALESILAGRAGGRPAMIHDTVVGEFRGFEHRTIRFAIDGNARRGEIEGVLSIAVDAVISRNGSGEPIYIDNVAHPAGRRLALARSTTTRLHAFGLELDMRDAGNNGHFAPFEWSG